MDCERCMRGRMVATTAPRMSSGIRGLGYVVATAGLFLILLGTARGVMSTDVPGGADGGLASEARQDAVEQLRRLDGMLDSLVADFETDGTVSSVALSQIPDNDRVIAESIISAYETGLDRGDAGGATGSVGVAIGSWAIGVPLLVGGGLLTRHRKVWECPSCAFIRDRPETSDRRTGSRQSQRDQ